MKTFPPYKKKASSPRPTPIKMFPRDRLVTLPEGGGGGSGRGIVPREMPTHCPDCGEVCTSQYSLRQHRNHDCVHRPQDHSSCETDSDYALRTQSPPLVKGGQGRADSDMADYVLGMKIGAILLALILLAKAVLT